MGISEAEVDCGRIRRNPRVFQNKQRQILGVRRVDNGWRKGQMECMLAGADTSQRY